MSSQPLSLQDLAHQVLQRSVLHHNIFRHPFPATKFTKHLKENGLEQLFVYSLFSLKLADYQLPRDEYECLSDEYGVQVKITDKTSGLQMLLTQPDIIKEAVDDQDEEFQHVASILWPFNVFARSGITKATTMLQHMSLSFKGASSSQKFVVFGNLAFFTGPQKVHWECTCHAARMEEICRKIYMHGITSTLPSHFAISTDLESPEEQFQFI